MILSKRFFIILMTVLVLAFTPVTAEVDSNVKLPTDTRLSGAVALYVGSSLALTGENQSFIDNSNHDVVPYIKNNRTLVPVRFISEKLGSKVDWKSNENKVIISLNENKVEIIIGKTEISVNGKQTLIDSPAEIKNDRTFVPLRSLVESLGKKVFYDRGLIIISEKEALFNPSSDKTTLDFVISRLNNLPVVGNKENLKNILSNLVNENGLISDEAMNRNRLFAAESAQSTVNGFATPSSANSKMSLAKKEVAASDISKNKDYSKTNVQVEGVDEGDVVKTDGDYIYKVNPSKIVVAHVYPAENMKVVSTISFDEKNILPQELYIDKNSMIVIGTSSPYATYSIKDSAKMPVKSQLQNTVKAIVYNIEDKENIKQIREVEIEGSYLSSRKINSSIYLLSNKAADIYYLQNGENNEMIAPLYRDSAENGSYKELDLGCIRYFPDSLERNFLTIAGFNLEKPNEKANISSYLGAGDQIYVSTQNLYVTLQKQNYHIRVPMLRIPPSESIAPASPFVQESQQMTKIYKFSLNEGNVTYLNKGEVPGTILNQFSMDENQNYFRIATTKSGIWTRNGQNLSTNNLYILDETMSNVGKIEDIAPGEKIYSTRFLGNRAYIVTFKMVDPLFVIDLSSPTAPKILGKLKIPGYSDYLHPYDENHIIGFGKDTVEGKNTAYYMGMKMAMFDVTDVTNPKQQFAEIIGDRGTDSELLRNHKALLFSKEKNLIAFPVTVMRIDKNYGENHYSEVPQYGTFDFQGAYVYRFDMQNGFKLRGKISHLSDEDMLKASSYGQDPAKYVERILYSGDVLYTLSQKMIKANNLENLAGIGELNVE